MTLVDDSAHATAGAPATAAPAWRTIVLAGAPVTLAALVYYPIVANYFFAGDFLNFYNLTNDSLPKFLLQPHGGHLLVVRNAIWFLCFELFGTNASFYYATAIVLHLINVYLVFTVIRLLTNSDRLACAGAALWGVSPAHAQTLGWYSVFGQVLAATLLLGILRQLARAATGGALPRHAVFAWCAVLLVAIFSFGVAIGFALIFPAVVWLLLPPSPARNRITLGCAVFSALMVPFYFAMTRLYFYLYPEAPGFVVSTMTANLRRWPEIIGLMLDFMGYGLQSLLLSIVPVGTYPNLAAYGLAGLTIAAVAVALARAEPAAQKRILAALVLAVGCYGIVAAGRVSSNEGRFLLVQTGRYQYVPELGLVFTLCLTAAALAKWRPIRARTADAVLIVWLVLAALAHNSLGRQIDHHQGERREAEKTVFEIRRQIAAAPPGQDVFIVNKRFTSVGPLFINLPDRFPGWAAVFSIFFPSNVVDGRRVFFVDANPAVLEAAGYGRRTATLLVAAPASAPR